MNRQDLTSQSSVIMSKEYNKLWGELPKPKYERMKRVSVHNWPGLIIPSGHFAHDWEAHYKNGDLKNYKESKYGCSMQCHDYCTVYRCNVPERYRRVGYESYCPVLHWQQVAFARECISYGLTLNAATSQDWEMEDEEYHGACYKSGWFLSDCAWENKRKFDVITGRCKL